MSIAQPITILDVAYEVLSRSDRPLSPEQIALSARGIGYNLTGWDMKVEIDAHLDSYGYRSPFTEIGRDRYGLFPLTVYARQSPAPSLSLLPIFIGLVLLMVLFLASMGIALDRPVVEAQVAVEVVAESLSPPASDPQIFPAPRNDPSWWTANSANQINSETQEVARQYLRNYYNTCGPAVVAMMASYYRTSAGSTEGRVTGADVLRDAKNILGYYNPPYNSGLLTFDHLRDMVGLYGLSQFYPQGEGSLLTLDEFLDGVRQGYPAIAGMRYGYQRDGWRYVPSGGRGLYNHFVVVFAVEQIDGQEHLWVYNPHPGKYLYDDSDAAPLTISVEQFNQSWALKDGSQYSGYGHAVFYQADSD